MSYWNYRVLKQVNPKNNKESFEICEVHYDENDRPHLWTEKKSIHT